MKEVFYNNSFKKWLKDSDIEMYSTHTERFIRTLKTKICKDMASVSKNVIHINEIPLKFIALVCLKSLAPMYFMV